MPDRPLLPVPGWLLAADFVSALLLALGLMLHFDEGMAPRMGLPTGSATAFAVFGALGLLSCAFAIVRHLRAAAASRSSFPR